MTLSEQLQQCLKTRDSAGLQRMWRIPDASILCLICSIMKMMLMFLPPDDDLRTWVAHEMCVFLSTPNDETNAMYWLQWFKLLTVVPVDEIFELCTTTERLPKIWSEVTTAREPMEVMISIACNDIWRPSCRAIECLLSLDPEYELTSLREQPAQTYASLKIDLLYVKVEPLRLTRARGVLRGRALRDDIGSDRGPGAPT